MTLDWHDLATNGMPAVTRALEQIQRELTTIANQQALLAYRLQQADALQQLEPRATPAPPPAPNTHTEVVAEFGYGWRLERQPTNTPVGTAGVLADTWIAGDWVQQYAAAADAR